MLVGVGCRHRLCPHWLSDGSLMRGKSIAASRKAACQQRGVGPKRVTTLEAMTLVEEQAVLVGI